MAAFGVRIYCYENGVTTINLNFVSQRSGSNNDNCQFRIVRRRSGFADKILAGEPFFVLLADKTAWNWQWIDEYVPAVGDWDYVLQVKKLDGAGLFSQMTMNAVHNKR